MAANDIVIRTKSGVPVEADFQNIVTRDGGFTRIYMVIDTDTGRPYTRLSDGTIQPIPLGSGSSSGTNTGDVTLGAAQKNLSLVGQELSASQWLVQKLSVDVGETLTIDANYGAVFPKTFTNNGTVINNGQHMVA